MTPAELEARDALTKLHRWLERVDAVTMGLDHQVGENDDACSACHAIAVLEGRLEAIGEDELECTTAPAPSTPPPRASTPARIGGWHAGDPETSRLAAIDNYPRIGSQRERALLELAAKPATAAELTLRLGWAITASGSSAAKRLSELRARGLAETTGQRRRTPMGSLADEYRVTEAGAQAIAHVRRELDRTHNG